MVKKITFDYEQFNAAIKLDSDRFKLLMLLLMDKAEGEGIDNFASLDPSVKTALYFMMDNVKITQESL